MTGNTDSKQYDSPLLDIKASLRRVDKLPPMPEMTQKIIRLSSDPDASIDELAKIVELDPSLAAQVMRYSSSPFFSYQGNVDSVHTAISRVLGFSMVMNLALGVTAAKPFRIPNNIPLGLDAFWRHAVFSAALTQGLSGALPRETRPPAGLAYLAGLLHNFGHLLLGHLFRKEFLILNKFISAEPDRPIVDIERQIIGLEHGEVGALLMEAWKLPEEIIVATREHNNLDYHGSHSVYANLVMLADYMLKGQGIGDAPSVEVPSRLYDALDIGEYQAVVIMNRVLEGCDGLENMAIQLAS